MFIILKKMYLRTILIVLLLSLTCITNATTPKDALVIGINTQELRTLDPGVVYESRGSKHNREYICPAC